MGKQFLKPLKEKNGKEWELILVATLFTVVFELYSIVYLLEPKSCGQNLQGFHICTLRMTQL